MTVCGEMAGRPLEAMTLIGLGFRRLSMSAAAIGPVKAMLLALDTGPLAKRLSDLLSDAPGVAGSPLDSLRGALAEFAAQHGIPV